MMHRDDVIFQSVVHVPLVALLSWQDFTNLAAGLSFLLAAVGLCPGVFGVLEGVLNLCVIRAGC